MIKKSTILAPLALACGLFSVGTADAALTMFTSRADFTAALTGVSTDGFNDLTPGAVYVSPADLILSTYGYTAAAADGLFAVGNSADVWLSTVTNRDALSLGNFSSGVAGVGADFFVTDISGAFTADGSLTVTGFDADGGLSQTLAVSSLTNFVGFISSTGAVSAVVVTNNRPGNDEFSARFATVNDLALGTVPEPGTVALVLAALALVPLLGRRRPI